MKDVFWDAFMDGFTGAGLFGKLPMPRERGESVECDRYAVYSRNWALISATAMTIGFVYLKRNGHNRGVGSFTRI
jgi:hypothetical protein